MPDGSATGRQDGYRLHGWMDAAPEELIASYAEARPAIGDAPSQDMDWEDPDWTPQLVRDEEAEYVAAGQEHRVVVAVHESSGEVAGITALLIRPGDPDHARQLDTAVRKTHRGHGLGRAIKAEMMRRLVADRPGLARVSTQTAANNVYMAAVNHSIGYADLRSLAYYEIPFDALATHLGSRTACPVHTAIFGDQAASMSTPDLRVQRLSGADWLRYRASPAQVVRFCSSCSAAWRPAV
jgi:mycothiol synthase